MQIHRKHKCTQQPKKIIFCFSILWTNTIIQMFNDSNNNNLFDHNLLGKMKTKCMTGVWFGWQSLHDNYQQNVVTQFENNFKRTKRSNKQSIEAIERQKTSNSKLIFFNLFALTHRFESLQSVSKYGIHWFGFVVRQWLLKFRNDKVRFFWLITCVFTVSFIIRYIPNKPHIHCKYICCKIDWMEKCVKNH